MRMKEDHMLNGQLKPGYNIQVGTENGYVTFYQLFSNPTDTKTLIPLLNGFRDSYGQFPSNVIADKGYGSLENYETLESNNIEAYIKYSYWEQEEKKRSKKYRYRSWNFKYNADQDELICPEGQPLIFDKEIKKKNWSGQNETLRLYTGKNCQDCLNRSKCTKRECRSVQLNRKRQHLYKQARARISTKEGSFLYRKRAPEVETVFGQIKGNQSFRRFQSWGMNGGNCDWGIQMIGYNLRLLQKQK